MLKRISGPLMDDNSIWEYLKSSWPVLSLGVFGGFVSLISGEKKITVRVFFGGLLLSAFVALMVDSLVSRANVGQNVTVVSVGMASFCSRELIEIARRAYIARARRTLGGNDVSEEK
ncbi:hypothetical protein KAU11_08365 [Candidatus Babeliales bacterium]|nr:hypothetical protein [Candidatus Babeliales bacterium]